MTIPNLNNKGELPGGEHEATLQEINSVYGASNERRKILMRGLHQAAQNFSLAGVKKIWVNGSFITDKAEPNDIDGCWEYTASVDIQKLDPVFLNSRQMMKDKYGLDFFISNYIETDSGLPFPKFFQVNRNGKLKGIILVRLGEPE